LRTLFLAAVRFIMKSLGIMCIIHAFLSFSCAAHPLITDDTGTQGKGKFLVELNGQASYDSMDSVDDTGAKREVKSRETELKANFTYGVMENVDVILGVPYQWKRVEESNITTSDVHGIADMSL